MLALLVFCFVIVAFPTVAAWYARLELIAPFVKTPLLEAGHRPRALPAPSEPSSLVRDRGGRLRGLLDDATAFRAGLLTRDYTVERRGFEIGIRTHPRIVDEHGSGLGISHGLLEQTRSRRVLVTWLVIDLSDRLPRNLAFHRELGEEERGFGDEALVSGILTGKLRTALGRGDRLTLGEGRWILESPFMLARARFEATLDAWAEAAERLLGAIPDGERQPDLSALLLEVLEEDPAERARATAADLLITRFPKMADRAAAIALSDESLEVQLAAARHLGAEGFQLIERIVLGDEQQLAPSALRQRALRFMVREHDHVALLPVFRTVLEEGPDSLRRIAVAACGERAEAEAIPWMRKLAEWRDAETVATACVALSRMDDPRAEALLISALRRPEPTILRAAIDALVLIGTSTAVPALKLVSEQHADRELRFAAATAMLLVEGRAAPSEVGALSVVDPNDEAGGLALVAASDDGAARDG